MADVVEAASSEVEDKKLRKNSASSDLKKVVKSAGINVIKKGIKMGGFQQQLGAGSSSKKHKQTTSPDMFDYSKGEASALGFEPLAAQAAKPEINVMKLCDYSQVLPQATEVEAEQQLVNSAEDINKPSAEDSSSQQQLPAKRVVTFSSKVRWKTSQNSLRKASSFTPQHSNLKIFHKR